MEQLPAESDSYGVTDWGTPGSGVRLQKIAERLRINVTNQSALGHHEAAKQNLDDLRWLRLSIMTEGIHFAGRPTLHYEKTPNQRFFKLAKMPLIDDSIYTNRIQLILEVCFLTTSLPIV